MRDVIARRLIRSLSASEYRTGEAIGIELGCSSTEVHDHVETLRNLGIAINADVGAGYILREPLELLDERVILAGLEAVTRGQLRGLDSVLSLDSTNTAVGRLPLADQHARVILAEHQSGGRGRRGRQWHSPFGRNLYLSMGWMFEQPMAALACLPLVLALATAQALSRAGLNGHKVKWPNDILLAGQKLCGCLVEVQGDANGPCHAVMGVGINVNMPRSAAESVIDQPWTDLNTHLPDCSRNHLAVLLLTELIRHVGLFAQQGFAPFREPWQQMDGLQGKLVDVWTGGNPVHGIARGVDDSGALQVDTGDELLCLHSGEASLQEPPGSAPVDLRG